MVWTQVLFDDDHASAVHSAEIFDDPRVTQFYDERLLGRAVAPIVGLSPRGADRGAGTDVEALAEHFQRNYLAGPPAVFDTVFFFDGEAVWNERDGVPTPKAWVTQLNPSMFPGLDPDRFRWDQAFHAELTRIGRELWSGH